MVSNCYLDLDPYPHQSLDPAPYSRTYFSCRLAENTEVDAEMQSFKEMGEQFHQESGQLMRLVGVLRAADILWNPKKE